MNVEYFESTIQEELEGAELYAKLAIEYRVEHPAWSKKFLEMSANELTHAKSLYTMYQEFYNSLKTAYTEMPKYIEDTNERINYTYTDCFVKTKMLHDEYGK